MANLYDELIQSIVQTGVSEVEAKHAARRCAMAMAKHGLVGYASGGAFSYFLSMNPATAMPYILGGLAIGAGHALVKSPQCSEVRQAINFWNDAAF